MVVTLRIVFCQILSEYIVTSRGKTVATHATIVTLLIRSLTCRGQSYYYITRTDVSVVNHVAALHTASNGRVDDDGAYKVAHISCLTSSGIDTYTHVTHLGK